MDTNESLMETEDGSMSVEEIQQLSGQIVHLQEHTTDLAGELDNKNQEINQLNQNNLNLLKGMLCKKRRVSNVSLLLLQKKIC